MIFVLLLLSLSFRIPQSTFKIAFKKEFWYQLLKYFYSLLIKSSFFLSHICSFSFPIFPWLLLPPCWFIAKATHLISLPLCHISSFIGLITGFSFSTGLLISLFSLSSWLLIIFYLKSLHTCLIFLLVSFITNSVFTKPKKTSDFFFTSSASSVHHSAVLYSHCLQILT